MPSISHILVSVIGLALLLAQGSFMNPVQAIPTLVNDATVQHGAKVTVRLRIAAWDNPDITYSDTEKFIQGEHLIPPGLEQRVAGMHPGESITFPLSAAEAVGSYDETQIQTIPIVRILPEKALLDLNHPLAGKPLIVTLQIMTIENPD